MAYREEREREEERKGKERSGEEREREGVFLLERANE